LAAKAKWTLVVPPRHHGLNAAKYDKMKKGWIEILPAN
jgi:hypothetical protein